MGQDLTHFDEQGRARMVDISAKIETKREAEAMGRVVFSKASFDHIQSRGVKKGDIGSIAELAGIMGAKRTAELIPLCHPLPISGLTVTITPEPERHSYRVNAIVKTTGPTGVEMEALTAVTTACLTIYDMAKAVDKAMIIDDIMLLRKSGGISGDYRRD